VPRRIPALGENERPRKSVFFIFSRHVWESFLKDRSRRYFFRMRVSLTHAKNLAQKNDRENGRATKGGGT